MNRAEAKAILLLYRTEADAADPQVAEAMAFAQQDPELAQWFADYRGAQAVLREKFRAIPIPTALKEQIVSERAVAGKKRREQRMLLGAVAAIVVALAVLGWFILPHNGAPDDSLAMYQTQMMYNTKPGYSMDLSTGDLKKVQEYLSQHQAPADYTLPDALARTTTTGCAVKYWQGKKVSMICFSTGKPLPANLAGDLWLFVVDRNTVKSLPADNTSRFTDLNGNATVAWVQGDKLYLLSTPGDEQAVRKYL